MPQDLALSENATEPISHFSSGYFEAGWRRASVVHKAVDWGYDVLVTDVDLVWFQSPYLYTQQFPEVLPCILPWLGMRPVSHAAGLVYSEKQDWLMEQASARGWGSACSPPFQHACCVAMPAGLTTRQASHPTPQGPCPRHRISRTHTQKCT